MAEPRPMTAREELADERLPLFNVRRHDPVENPYGFDNDGYLVNQMIQAEDAGVMGRLARDMAIVGYENAAAADNARRGAMAAAGKAADDVRASVAVDVKAAQDARAGAEAAAGETADELRATFAADVDASQTARKGAEDAREATGLIRDAAAESARNADASARDAAASAESVDGPAIAARFEAVEASLVQNRRFAAAYALSYGRF